MALQHRRVLLTGGAGFIGSHVAEALLRRGTKVTIVDSLDRFYSPAWKKANLEEIRRSGRFEFVHADIRVPAKMRDIVARAKPDAVIHLAARAGVRPSLERPLLYEQVNLGGTVNLLELSRQFRIPRLVFASSSSVYGENSRTPFSEDQTDIRPVSPYGATKLAGETLCCTYAHLYPISIMCLRFFTVYGPRQRPDLAIHKFTGLIERGKPVPIFGDGSTGRDYTYVADTVAGVLAALEYENAERNRTAFEIFNLGNSRPIQLSELVEAIEQATGRKANRIQKPLQPGDVPLTWADTAKSCRLLGYRPTTPFEEGLRKFVAWYRARSPRLRA